MATGGGVSALGPTSEEVEIMGHNYGLCSVAIEVRPSTVVAETSAGGRRAARVPCNTQEAT